MTDTTRELHTVELPNGRRIGFYDFDFTPVYHGSRLDPPESAEVTLGAVFWVDGDRPVELTSAELSVLHFEDVAAYACVLEFVEALVERRTALRIGERVRAKSDAVTAHLTAAASCYKAASTYLRTVALIEQALHTLPAWRWRKVRNLRRQLREGIESADEYERKGSEQRDAAHRLRKSD